MGVADYILAAFLFILIVISWYYHFSIYGKIKAPAVQSAFSQPVSILIAARNELTNLQHNLPHWLNQEYGSYEVIIADDGSTDGTSDWIIEQMPFNSKLKLVMLDAQYVKMHGKKIALTLAIKKSTCNYFVLTDADCTPASVHWLSKMTSGFGAGKDIVLGFSPYEKKAGLLNSLIRYETLTTALNCFGFAINGKPYMGVGRNLAFTRAIYDKVQGYASHSHIPAGDDDLFVQSAANANNVALVLDEDANTISFPKLTFKSWWKQKVRHLWVGKFYSSDAKRMLSVLPTVQLFFLLGFIAWLILASKFWYPLVFLGLKLIPEWWVKGKKAKIFQSKDLQLSIPFLSAINQFFYMISGIGAFFAKKPKW